MAKTIALIASLDTKKKEVTKIWIKKMLMPDMVIIRNTAEMQIRITKDSPGVRFLYHGV